METFITVRKGLFKKRVGLRFDMAAYFDLMERHGIDINKGTKEDPEKFMFGLIHCAAIRYCEKHIQKIWFNESDIKDWILKIQYGEMEQLKTVMNNSAVTLRESAEKFRPSGKEEKKK